MIKPGQKVTYIPDNGKDPERGILKSIPNGEDSTHVFVVYSVDNEDWDNYESYTAASTPVKDLIKGWPADPNKHFKYYLHSDKDSNFEYFRDEAFEDEGGLTDEFIMDHDLHRVAYEVEFDCILTPDGKALATHVNGVKLEKPVEL